MLAIDRQPQGFRATRAQVTEEVRTVLRSGEIRSSLFGAADAAGIPDQITLALADVFAGDIDFYHDLRRGDRFTVLYEMRLVDGEPVGAGRILAAEFVNGGKTLSAFRWRDAEGTEGYFTADGRNTRGAFLRSPMEFSRITSGFSLARMHPILNTWRAHKGVDYGAPMGTPVRATADGIVTFAGVQGGYGNVIFLRHHGSYSTVYGHLSRFAPHVKNGARVTPGRDDRLRRPHRLGHGPASALRVPDGGPAARSADRGVARARNRSRRSTARPSAPPSRRMRRRWPSRRRCPARRWPRPSSRGIASRMRSPGRPRARARVFSATIVA